MQPKLILNKNISTHPDWNSYIGKEVESTVKELEQYCKISPYVVKEDSLGEYGYRKVTMEGNRQRIIIVGKKITNATWIVLDIFVSTIGKDEPEKPFE